MQTAAPSGPLVIARLVCGLPVDDASLAALPEPWRDLADSLLAAPPDDRLPALSSTLARHPDGATLSAEILAEDPEGDGGRRKGESVPSSSPSPFPLPREAHLFPSPTKWLPPIPFAKEYLPAFPADVLPPWLRDFVRAEALATQTPLDLAGVLALAVLSAACAGRAVVRPWADWLEPLNLYALVVLPPGHRKSAVFAAVARPLQELEAEAARDLAPAIAEADSARRIAEQTLHRAQDAAARAPADDRDVRVAEARRLAAELAALRVPARPRLIVDDCSPERLGTLLHEQGGRIAVMSPEGGIFDLMAGRYSASGGPNFEHFLKGHAGDPIIVDRVGRPGELIPRPAITVGLAVQPEVLRGLMGRPGFHGRGLLARFLYALPQSPLGRRRIDPPAVPDSVRAEYERRMKVLGVGCQVLGDNCTSPSSPNTHHRTPNTLVLTEAAAARLKWFAGTVEPSLGEGGELERLVDWGGKLVGAVARLAGLLHLAAYADHSAPWQLPIEDGTMRGAIVLGAYFAEHAKAAYAAMGADPALDDARYLLRWIRRTGATTFTRRDVFEATKGRFRQVDHLVPALRALEQHGYIRERQFADRGGPGRRPSPIYDVTPHLRGSAANGSSADGPAAPNANSANCANSAKGG